MKDIEGQLRIAVQAYWETRFTQDKKQGGVAGIRDYGNRSAVTGGAQLNGFIELIRLLVVECGITDADVHTKQTVIPGFYRPAKDWDVVVVTDGILLATIEVKSHAGPSFGNNFNNRVEEALGNATDFWAAYQHGAFKPSTRPFLGYLMLLEEDAGSMTSVKERKKSRFPVLDEFANTSYADRYRLFCHKILRDRLYDGACFLMSNRAAGLKGFYREPDVELSFKSFALGLQSRALAYSNQRK